ncbi:glutathione synthetase [Betaproteobacteria bacterium]|nr:glutathione synthetase [Betaproteobacteria bacterium]GHU15999.1 glutathione synthetase [Betaproteobacteria bacterium]
MTNPLELAFILDPLPGLKARKDSSVAMMRAAAARGHRSWAILRDDLFWREGRVSARATALELHADDHDWYTASEVETRPLEGFDAVLMRQDPPFDFEYVAATWLLERAVAQGARVFNAPRAVRDHSEKLSITEFSQFTATSLVARAPADIHTFIDEIGEVILKPLDGMGGSQIFRVAAHDPNRNVIVETLTCDGTRSIMAQRYLPGIREGDKRVLIIGGEIVPYALARIPREGETRGNLAAGGRGVVMPLTVREWEIAGFLAPVLWERGLLIVGLDIIDGHLTEINVTSPTCMVEISARQGFDVPGLVIDALEKLCAR